MVNKVDVKCKAELLAVELILEDKSKIVIVTYYRVGTLGIDNANDILSTITVVHANYSATRAFLFKRL